MPTYLVWDREVLEECYDQVDGISLHAYYGNTPATDRQQHGALPGDEPRHGSADSRDRGGLRLRAGAAEIEQAAVAVVRRVERLVSRPRAATAIDGRRAVAPKLLEEVYNLEDALLVGGFVNTLLRNSDRVRVACLAQLVNVIAPLVTQRDAACCARASTIRTRGRCSYARGRVLDLRVESETYPITAAGLQADFARNDQVPFVDVVATLDAPNGQASVLMLNRDLDGERELVAGVGRCHADARARVRDADRAGPEGVQHVRAAAAAWRRSGSTRPRAGSADDVQAAGAVLHRRPARRQPPRTTAMNEMPEGEWMSKSSRSSGSGAEPPRAAASLYRGRSRGRDAHLWCVRRRQGGTRQPLPQVHAARPVRPSRRRNTERHAATSRTAC